MLSRYSCSALFMDTRSFFLPRISDLADSDGTYSEVDTFSFSPSFSELDGLPTTILLRPQLDYMHAPRHHSQENLLEDYLKVEVSLSPTF